MGIVETEKYIAREEGLEKGRENKAEEVVTNVIVAFGFSDEQAAKLADVSIDFVCQVRLQIK